MQPVRTDSPLNLTFLTLSPLPGGDASPVSGPAFSGPSSPTFANPSDGADVIPSENVDKGNRKRVDESGSARYALHAPDFSPFSALENAVSSKDM